MRDSDWLAIEAKLKRENKTALVQLIQELTAVSPEVQRYIQTRYLKKKNLAHQIAPYRKVIEAQFVLPDWDNSVICDFDRVQKALDDYNKSSQGDEVGLAELLVVSVETAVIFADRINLHAVDFQVALGDLLQQCIEHLESHSPLLATYKPRLRKIQQMAGNLYYEDIVDSIEDLIYPFD